MKKQNLMKFQEFRFTILALLSFPYLILSLPTQIQASGKTGWVQAEGTRTPLAKAKVIYISEDGSIRKEVMSSEAGRYQIDLPEGRYKVSATLDGYIPYSTETGFSIVKGSKMMTHNIFMTKTGQVKKRVISSVNRQANSGFVIVEQKSSPQIGVLVEYFKLDHRKANQLIRQYASKAANAGELRDALGEMTKKGEAELIETGWVRGMSGQRVKTESVREDIYPTDYDAPKLSEIVSKIARAEAIKANPQAIATQQPAKMRFTGNPTNFQIHMSSATPAAFETRNVGLTLEVDPVISANNKIIDLSLSPEIVTRMEDAHFTRPGFEDKARGVDNISAATFYKIQTTTQIRAIPGNYNLLTIHTPPDETDKRIIVLLKADIFRAK